MPHTHHANAHTCTHLRLASRELLIAHASWPRHLSSPDGVGVTAVDVEHPGRQQCVLCVCVRVCHGGLSVTTFIRRAVSISKQWLKLTSDATAAAEAASTIYLDPDTLEHVIMRKGPHGTRPIRNHLHDSQEIAAELRSARCAAKMTSRVPP